MKNLPKAICRCRFSCMVMLSMIVLFTGVHQMTNAQSRLHPRDWKLGIQAWSFHLNTLAEALDKMDSCGVKFMEGFPPQKIGAGIAGTMDYHMDAATQQKVLKLLRKKGIKMVSYGVVSPKTDGDWMQLFKFAKAMGLTTIVSEPTLEQIPMISKLCDEYKIDVAIHNHARPTHYWSPEIVLAAIKGASPRIGACADIGHWLESGLDPVECMKKLRGHIKEFHMKDENMKGRGKGAHDVPMGTGVIDMAGVMQEMKRQDFKGFAFIEYEYHFKDNVPDVKASADYFRKERAKLLK
jgi:sugar phosphate isomerase/epimerase